MIVLSYTKLHQITITENDACDLISFPYFLSMRLRCTRVLRTDALHQNKAKENPTPNALFVVRSSLSHCPDDMAAKVAGVLMI